MISTRELMIGDWVNIPQANVGLRKIDVGDISFFTEFDPIPLTPEILAKNGINGGLWEDYYGHTLFVNNNRIKYFFDGHRRLDLPYNRVIYVHELQHALRLCGLDDLADNFKV